jgi:hypothetical protein
MVFYIYPDKNEAIHGGESGGTGFLFFVPSEHNTEVGFHYAITDAHVIFDGVYQPVLRINTKDGNFDIIETSQSQWIRHPDGDDIAVTFVGLNKDIHNYGNFHREDILTKDFIEKQDVGVGDEVIMVGRFRVHSGKKKNLPVTMFGNIAMMPDEPILNPFTGLAQESFLVEMRSIPGFSGSPVMLYIPPLAPRPSTSELKATWHWRLLGICWGQISVSVKGYDTADNEYKIKLDSAMTAVVPAWKIMDILDGEDMIEIRKIANERWKTL